VYFKNVFYCLKKNFKKYIIIAIFIFTITCLIVAGSIAWIVKGEWITYQVNKHFIDITYQKPIDKYIGDLTATLGHGATTSIIAVYTDINYKKTFTFSLVRGCDKNYGKPPNCIYDGFLVNPSLFNLKIPLTYEESIMIENDSLSLNPSEKPLSFHEGNVLLIDLWKDGEETIESINIRNRAPNIFTAFKKSTPVYPDFKYFAVSKVRAKRNMFNESPLYQDKGYVIYIVFITKWSNSRLIDRKKIKGVAASIAHRLILEANRKKP
jgi:hypothetical protein